jgi:hypothetical protein
MADDLTAIEFFLAEKHPEQRTLPGPIAANKPDLDVVVDRGFGTIQEHPIAVTLDRFGNLQQGSHRGRDPQDKW